MHVYLLEMKEHGTMICASKAYALEQAQLYYAPEVVIDHDATGIPGYDDACMTLLMGNEQVAHIWRMPVMGFVSL